MSLCVFFYLGAGLDGCGFVWTGLTVEETSPFAAIVSPLLSYQSLRRSEATCARRKTSQVQFGWDGMYGLLID